MSLHAYTRYVTFMRGFLPLIAVVALTAVVAWPLVNEWKQEKLSKYHLDKLTAEDVALTMPAAGKPAQLQVTKPEFLGRDQQGRPYVITATRVLQDVHVKDPQTGAMTLEAPSARLTLDQDKHETVTLQAATGVYDPQKQTLTLDKDVKLTHSDGYTLDMHDLFVDLVKGISMTRTHVSGGGPLGSLSGESLELRDKGNHIILHGKSKVVLTPKTSG